MVILGLFRKSKLPTALGSPEAYDIVPSQIPLTPCVPAPPVLRNFSYPVSVISAARTPANPIASREGQSPWEQLGEICNFSPDTPSRVKTSGLEGPFFFRRDQDHYMNLTDQEDQYFGPTCTSNETQTKVEPTSRRKQRRSVFFLSTSQSQNTPLFSGISNISQISDKKTKAPKNKSLGDHTFPHKPSVASKLKRTSIGQHKAVSSLDASKFHPFRSISPGRPASSLGIPIVDTRLKHISLLSAPPFLSPTLGHSESASGFAREGTLTVETLQSYCHSEMDSSHGKRASQSSYGQSCRSSTGRRRGDSSTESVAHKGKDGKGRWLAQIKDWLSTSEPSTQALKNYKKDAYKRAGIALDDPRATAKLNIPSATLPPEAIRPSGRGPEPEEIVRRKAEKKKQGQTYNTIGATCRGSRTSASQQSSASSLNQFGSDA